MFSITNQLLFLEYSNNRLALIASILVCSWTAFDLSLDAQIIKAIKTYSKGGGLTKESPPVVDSLSGLRRVTLVLSYILQVMYSYIFLHSGDNPYFDN
jgi:hypothetical protein